MHARSSLRLLTVFLGFTFSASAQFDAEKFAAALPTNYGSPLHREIFSVPVGEMVVDYAANGHVCGIQLPAIGPEEGRKNVMSARGVDDFLLKLLPLSMRGKEVGKMNEAFGAPSVSVTQYENVAISVLFQGDTRTGVTATFANEKCQDRPAQ